MGCIYAVYFQSKLIIAFYLDYSKINRNFAIERIIINLITRQAYEEIQL